MRRSSRRCGHRRTRSKWWSDGPSKATAAAAWKRTSSAGIGSHRHRTPTRISWPSCMRKQFKDTLMDLAEADERIVLVFGDISVFLFDPFARRFPTRFYNLGICENTLVSVAAGLSSQGFIPFV